MNRPVVDFAPLFDDVCNGEITLSELESKLDEYNKKERAGVISLCYKGIPIFKSKYLVPEATIKHYKE